MVPCLQMYVQVFSVITVICAAVTASRIDVKAIYDALRSYARLGISVPAEINERLTKNIGAYICSILLLTTCIGVVIREIFLLLCSVFNHRCSSKLVLIIVSVHAFVHIYYYIKTSRIPLHCRMVSLVVSLF